MELWRQTAQDANEKPVLTLKEQKELEKLRAQDQREIKALMQELQRKEKAMAENGSLFGAAKKVGGLLLGGRGRPTSAAHRRKAIELIS